MRVLCISKKNVTKQWGTPDKHVKANKKSNLFGSIGYHYRLNAEGSRLGVLLTEESGYPHRNERSGG